MLSDKQLALTTISIESQAASRSSRACSVKMLLQDVALLSVNGPASSMGSPYAHSVAARSGQESHSGSTALEHVDPHLQLIHQNKCAR